MGSRLVLVANVDVGEKPQSCRESFTRSQLDGVRETCEMTFECSVYVKEQLVTARSLRW